MRILAVRSIPLSKATADSWRAAGVRFAKRHRRHDDIARIVERYDYDAILNLGSLGIAPDGAWNSDDTIRAVSHRNLRRTLDGEGMPAADTTQGPHWHKTGGWGGMGTTFHAEPCHWNGDHAVQQHVEGDEYRVVTVGNKVVQASRKVNCEWRDNGRHYFDYEWCGVAGIRTNGIIPLLHSSVDRVPGGERSVLGWDIIVDDRPYIIECNTSPGVNIATAQRVVAQMEDVLKMEEDNE